MLDDRLISLLDTITIINVGSRKVDDEDIFAKWGSQLGSKLKIIGFDADEDACEMANHMASSQPWHEEHIPLIVAEREKEATLYVTSNPCCTSLYRPNLDYLSQFPTFVNFFEVDYTLDVTTTTLDKWASSSGVSSCDFIQTDVQGADLDVLRGASNLLNSVLALKVEVLFAPLYLEQPLFDDVNSWLLERGFTFFDFDPIGYYRRVNIERPSRHQLLWGDAYYFKLPVGLERSQLVKLAVIADILQFHDFAAYCLEKIPNSTQPTTFKDFKP